MSYDEAYCPGGEASQSGSAVRGRYSQAIINDCGKIPDVGTSLQEGGKGPYIIPIWNSNEGEIEASEFVWNLIEESKVKILDLWPKIIEFWFVVKTGSQPLYKMIGSVRVAETQCSDFLEGKKSHLKQYSLTTDAFIGYKAGDKVDGVLVAPGQGEEDGYTIACKKTANKNNFTSFVTLTTSNSTYTNCNEATSWLTGVTLGNVSGDALDDEQTSFFNELFLGSKLFKDIPKLVFVFKRVDRIGLLIEGEQYSAGDLLDAEQLEAGEIIVHETAGELERPYTQELNTLLSSQYKELIEGDFILHRGKVTVLFSCPVLDLYTHGFEEKTVEPVVRLYIDMIFEYINIRGPNCCSDEQYEFFLRFRPSWQEQRLNFIKFKVI